MTTNEHVRPFLIHLSVFPLLRRVLVLTPPLDPSTAVDARRAEAPAEGDILTASCDTANKGTVFHDELLLCKWPLTDTARRSPDGGGGCCDSGHLDDCGDLREGRSDPGFLPS